jgi:murein DD-endopeptidase MepM/ murein hydrolase activator NlpD
MAKRPGGKFEVIVIKDELGNYTRFKVSKFTVFSAVAVIILLLVGLTVKVITLSNQHSKEAVYRAALAKKLAELQTSLNQLSQENAKLKTQVAELQKEREETVKQLAKRVEIINSLMKKVGIKEENPGEGGAAIPIEKVLTDPEVDPDDVIPAIDRLIKDFKRTPITYPTYGRITSDFGLRRDPLTGALEYHLGVDIANRWGTPVRATAEGKVIKAGWCGEFGYCIEIDHKNGFRSVYGHLAKVLVKKGDRVERGMIIGLMGSTGKSTGPHLHYTLRYKGKIINPKPFLEVNLDKEER